MSAINPPPQKAPTKVSTLAPGFFDAMLKTLYLLWFNFNQRPVTSLTGTTASSQGATATVAHGIDATKIISVSVVVSPSSGSGRTAGDTSTGYQYSVNFDSSNINVVNHPSNSANILTKPFSVFITSLK